MHRWARALAVVIVAAAGLGPARAASASVRRTVTGTWEMTSVTQYPDPHCDGGTYIRVDGTMTRTGQSSWTWAAEDCHGPATFRMLAPRATISGEALLDVGPCSSITWTFTVTAASREYTGGVITLRDSLCPGHARVARGYLLVG